MVEVIGAGWGRTGTFSFKTAMEILDLPCYHMAEAFGNRDAKFWIRMADGDEPDLAEVLERDGKVFKATCDFPSAPFWREQLAKYPDAKVVLTVRDPDSWYRSCAETIFQTTPNSPHMPLGIRVAMSCGLPRMYEMTRKAVGKPIGDDWSSEAVKRSFEEHNNAVIRECPKDRLLVFRASDGWGPLCEFLGKPVPDLPYPHLNDSASMKRRLRLLNAIGWSIMVAPVVLVAGMWQVWSYY
eukprot:jgi/Tetstr1/448912/TSEL_036138.t1